ncbi:MAG: hypothetical protein V3S03_07085 [Vicinamibacteria bacterium]
MKERVPVWLVALALLASVGGRAEPMREDSGPRPATAQGRPAPLDVDLLEIRDIFRYADEPRMAPTPLAGGTQGAVESDDAPPQRTRLIGLVQRSDRLVAAVSIDGEVLLLAAGESALGFTVLDIREETVRLRDPDGDVEALELP